MQVTKNNASPNSSEEGEKKQVQINELNTFGE